MERIEFPPGFTWGTASAAYQVEGSPLADGAGPTTWHEFVHRRGTIVDGSTGDVACDHYNRTREDIRLMRSLGARAYRFSVGWGRVFPEKGVLNEKGLSFYERLVDDLLAAGIEPWLTVFHMEEPMWLAREGGFVRREAVDHLVGLGTLLFRRLGDRVKHWITVNEPTVHAVCGYFLGEFPPGRRFALRELFHCLHHLLLAHARLCDAWSSLYDGGMIGLAHHSLWTSPWRPDRRRDVRAASFMDDVANRTVLDAMFRGEYPAAVRQRLRRFFPRGWEDDTPGLRRPGTYVGINYYTRVRYRWSALVPYSHAAEVTRGQSRSAMWEIHAPGMRASLLRLKDEYGNPPCVVTENGFPLPDSPGQDPLDDAQRIDYLRAHVAEVGRAITSGVDCRGYFHWSLMDNFEWNKGLSMRFGLYHTDFATQERRPKKSAAWFAELVRDNRLETR